MLKRVDSTSQESAGAWRELLAGAGLKSAGLRGQGIFKDAASDATVHGYFFNAHDRELASHHPGFWNSAGPVPDHCIGIWWPT